MGRFNLKYLSVVLTNLFIQFFLCSFVGVFVKLVDEAWAQKVLLGSGVLSSAVYYLFLYSSKLDLKDDW